jgi:hypothetical protein
MKARLFPLTIISVVPILFAVPRSPRSPQASASFTSQLLFRQGQVASKVPESWSRHKASDTPFLAAITVSQDLSRGLLVWYQQALDKCGIRRDMERFTEMA